MDNEILISVICPTYKRATLQTRFADFVHKNCNRPETCEIVFGINDDDEIALQTTQELIEKYGDQFIRYILVDPEEALPNIANICVDNCRGDLLCNVADDVVFRSKDWDLVALSAFEEFDDKIMMLWSDDGLWGGRLASHYFIHKNWVKAVGYINVLHFYADWGDVWNQELVTRLGRNRVILNREVLFLEHMHAEHGKMEKDETHFRTRERAKRNAVENINYNSPQLVGSRDQDYMKLYKFIENYHQDEEEDSDNE